MGLWATASCPGVWGNLCPRVVAGRQETTIHTSIKTETLTVLITMCPTDLPKFDFIFIFYSSYIFYKVCSVYNLYLTNRLGPTTTYYLPHNLPP